MISQGNRAIVAVDGPAGAGKSTVARLLADQLGFLYLDTGAMYRALAWKSLHYGIDLRDEEAVLNLLQDTSIDLIRKTHGRVDILLDGTDVTHLLRGPEINASVSVVAGFAAVRNEMVRRQRQVAAKGRVVMDGRDIGTHVLPDAPVKFFLTASLSARARRRKNDLEQMGYTVDLTHLEQELDHRDMLDSNRPVAPLRQAADAILIDTTNMEVEEVVTVMAEVCHRRGL